jgi:hypothetical protein
VVKFLFNVWTGFIWGSKVGRWCLAGLTVFLTFYLAFFNHVAYGEAGIAWSRVTGALWVQPAGYHVTWPWVAVSTVETRPQRVCMTSASKAAFSCKLVRFDPAYFREFVGAEGHYYYWTANRVSFNGGYGEEYRGFRDVLRGYAYGSVRYPFLVVESETNP